MSELAMANLIVNNPYDFTKHDCVVTIAELAKALKHEKEICHFCTDDEHGALSIYTHKCELLETEIRQLKAQLAALQPDTNPGDIY